MFKTFLETLTETEEFENEVFGIQDIVESLQYLTQEEIQEVGEFIYEMLEDEDIEDMEDEDVTEAKYFDKKAHQVNKEKRLNKTERRKLAKKRKQWYKKNKAKVKRYNKRAAKKRKQGRTVSGKRITTHR